MELLVLGPHGTFSHEAAQELFPDATITLVPNMDALFEAVQTEHRLGFVPIENSMHGPVDEVIDQLANSDVKIWRTMDMRIRHAFGATHPDRVHTIASHPQALAQCRTYLKKKYPDAERFPVSSTSYAIDMAKEDPTTGAIASIRTMKEQGLPIVEENIEAPGNTTRFAIVATIDPFPNMARTQMGILLHPTEDRAGLLHDMLSPCKNNRVNLTRIESRPTGKKLGDYNFFLDLVGTKEDANVQQCFEEISAVAHIKVLGEW